MILVKSPTIVISFLSALCLSGCQGAYSASAKYPVRQDPLVLKGDKLDVETDKIDPPGLFPLMAIADLAQPHHPLHAKHQRANLLYSEELRDPTTISAPDRQAMAAFLDEHFGTPARPLVSVAFLNKQGVADPARATAFVETLQLETDNLARGRDLYRDHCLQCHGLSGDGRGLTARWINPHPRDFRHGLFKFQSVDQSEGRMHKPRREDLIRTIRQGIEGTAMPSFNLLHQNQLEDLASYVIHLAIRGETEFKIIWTCFDYDRSQGLVRGLTYEDDEDFRRRMQHWLQDTADKWLLVQGERLKIEMTPNPYPAESPGWASSVQRGQKLFRGELGKETGPASCLSCHLDYGRQAKYRYDTWGTLVRPNNLTLGVYHGGRRPIDLFRRIHSGINGSGMPAFGGYLKGPQLWDVLNFVMALPHPVLRDKAGIVID